VVAAVVVLIALAGAGLILGGLWWISPPVALIAGGAGALRLAWVISEMTSATTTGDET